MGSIDHNDTTPQLLNRLRMRQVALILAIDAHRTLRAAAAELGLSQPAATKMLHELESALGVSLFERQGRGLQLNAAGICVTRYFKDFRGGMEALNRELVELRKGSYGRLAIGSIMAASPGRLTQSLLAMRQQWPMLAMEVAVDTSDRLLAQLRDGVLEVVVGRLTSQEGADYVFRSLENEALSVVVGNAHPLASADSVALSQLLDYGWVLQPHGSPMRSLIEQAFRAQRLATPRDLIETGSMLTSMNLVRHSTMVTVLPLAVAQVQQEHGFLRIVPFDFGRELEAYGSIVRQDRPLSQPAQQFLMLLHQ
ncbi:LysR family transcriptional regulator [Lampropedia aestuarii]|uniref:LysR family transcriptional regulator n=1 Tax=Lampropedia aestuarii TaxID=2562762 RepID=A0A4S5BNJ3_9BURK|nr:LysR family transcriptional regulator [Lampropedia aestuarii]THJ34237.1 LysR family transcriptional regulator [Lampropedia aestuarii]